VAKFEVESEDGAVAPADDVGLADLERIHHRHHVVGHEIVTVRARVARACPVASAVHQDHGVMRRHRRDLGAPIVGVGEAAVQEEHRRALAVHRIVDLDPIGFDLAGAVGRDRRGRRRQGLPPLECGARERRKGETGGKDEGTHRLLPGSVQHRF
jgi:hypothetical protein